MSSTDRPSSRGRAAPPALQRGDWLAVGAVFFLLLAAYTATFVGLPDNPDAEVEFQTTSALARRGSFALGGTSEAELILSIEHHGQQGYNVRPGGPGREGRFYSWSGVAQPLVALPFYFAGRALSFAFPVFEERHVQTTHFGAPRSEYFEHLLVGWRNPLLGALTGALVVLAARRSGARRVPALLAGLGYGLTTYAWPQARSTLSDVQATFFLFVAFVACQAALERLEHGERPRVSTLLAFGCGLGGAFLTRMMTAPAVGVLVLLFAISAVRAARRAGTYGARELAFGLGPAILAFLFFLWINELRFGDPLESGYGDVVSFAVWFTQPPQRGLFGLLLSPGGGLLWMAPLVLLLPVWLTDGYRRRAIGELALVLGVALAVLLPIAVSPAWHGGWTYGPRYILPLLPVLWVGVGVGLSLIAERAWGRWTAAALALLGLGTALPGVLVDTMTHLDLATQAARWAWPDPPGATEFDREEFRFVEIKQDWRFAAPWAHARILAHRLAGRGEEFPVRELFGLERDERLTLGHEREKDFLHLAWVDFHRRLGGPLWPAVLLVSAFLALGVILARAARGQP